LRIWQQDRIGYERRKIKRGGIGAVELVLTPLLLNEPGMEEQMPNVELRFKVTLEINDKWARTQTTEELVDYIKARLNSSLGFRGQIKKLKMVAR
jgi:hypothetical protein